MGRRSKYTPEIAQTIIDGLSRGTPLTVICAGLDVTDKAVREWQAADEEFGFAIARARETGFDQIAQDALDIAENGSNDWVESKFGPQLNAEHVQRSKLRVETRLKLLAKWDPKRYGDKQQVEHSGQIGLAEMVLNSMKDREDKK